MCLNRLSKSQSIICAKRIKLVASHTVPATIEKQRLSDYAIGLFDQLPSRKSVKKAIKTGELLVNDQPATTGLWVTSGMCLTVVKKYRANKKAYKLDIKVLFEDNHLAVADKPAGLLTSGNAFKTLERALPHNLKPSTRPDAETYPKVVHRLDRATSGLVMVAKTASTRVVLGKMLENREIEKQYRAVVKGTPPQIEGELDTPINGQKALSYYTTLTTSTKYSLLKLKPATGRTHQLRLHCAAAGFPIIGDKLYGDPKAGPNKGLFLTAVSLRFSHPITNENLLIEGELPNKFVRFIKGFDNIGLK